MEQKNECTDIIDTMFQKYKDNEYVLNRIYTHIHNLPNTLETELFNYEKKQNLNAHLSEEQQIFIQVFLSQNNYYYLLNNNVYYEYDGTDYLIVLEDVIIHKLLSTISKNKTLLQWKYKTKINVLKQIKDRNLFSCIPESCTIQNVLGALYPSFFPSKNHAKYFLTIIGDNILKKTSDLIFIISPKTKQFIDELEQMSSLSIGYNNISQKMITKYHDNHTFQQCRLIQINANEYWREILKKIGLNLLCVAVHYSNRYNSSDQFVTNSLDEELIHYAFSLKHTSPQELLVKFMDNYIEKTTMDFKIEWKNIHFIWKQFLCNCNLPNVIYSNVLKTMLKNKLQYEEETDSFIGVTSKFLPLCKDFIQFWNETITIQYNFEFENELEVDEINQLFKLWYKKNTNLNEDNIIKMLYHFFSISVVDNKFILNVVSSLWNKFNDIENSMEYIKEQIQESISNNSLIHFDELYNYYNKHCIQKCLKLIVNKCYFEKYLHYKYSNYICYDKFIKIHVFYE